MPLQSAVNTKTHSLTLSFYYFHPMFPEPSGVTKREFVFPSGAQSPPPCSFPLHPFLSSLHTNHFQFLFHPSKALISGAINHLKLHPSLPSISHCSRTFFSFSIFGADLLLKQFSILWIAEHFVWDWGDGHRGLKRTWEVTLWAHPGRPWQSNLTFPPWPWNAIFDIN